LTVTLVMVRWRPDGRSEVGDRLVPRVRQAVWPGCPGAPPSVAPPEAGARTAESC